MTTFRSPARSNLRARASFRLDWLPAPRPELRAARAALCAGGARTFALDGAVPRLGALSYVADGAFLVGDVALGDHCSVWFGAVIRADNGPIRIGRQSNVQDAAVIHCLPGGEVLIGTQVSIGQTATIHGACIGDRCLIGMGAVVMDGVSIGHDTLVAAGSIVSSGRRFEPGTLLRGNPAQAVRALTDREVAGIQSNALQYVTRADRFRHALRRV